jgi:2-oxoisovalerate dehydrogenase E1 component
VVATVGDAATRQGEFYEALTFAVEKRLPIVLMVEDNRYGISTNTDPFNPFKLGIFDKDLGIVHVDARYPDRLFEASQSAMQRARVGGGPTVLVCSLDRLCSHTSSDDHRVYRTPQEISEMMERDPIHRVAQELIDCQELTRDEWESIQHEIDTQVDADYRRAEQDVDPDPGSVMDHLFGELPTAKVPPISGGQKMRMVDALNTVFHRGLESSRKFVFFGEDIEDPKGGVFRLTAGLSNKHPDRVFNSPLAEGTIAGIACGLASYGMKPVFELQFVDFVGPAWNQISQNISTLRWRTCGTWKCPAVIYAPYGAYLPGGAIWHSQANESAFAHIPGLRIVVPSTPEDAAGLVWTAMHADDPTIVLLPKHLIRQPMQVPAQVDPVPLGKGRLRREGQQVTLVAWGNCIELALEAATEVEDQVSVEVIDLRSIQPWDRDLIAGSLAKTGRLVIVQEDGQSCSVGQMIISELSHDPRIWYSFLSPPKLIAKPDVHIGYNPILEYAALPSRAEVVTAIHQVMEE